MEPIQAPLRIREQLVLQAPDVVGAVGDEECPLLAVAALDGFAFGPQHQRPMTLEGRDDLLVDGAFDSVPGSLQGVDDCHEADLGVLALVPLLSANLRVCVALSTTLRTSGRSAVVSFRPPFSPTRAFRCRDHWSSATVDLNHQNVAVTFGNRCLLDEGLGFTAHGIDESQGRSAARRPLVEQREGDACLCEGHHGTEPRNARGDPKTETAAQPQLAIDRQIGLRGPLADLAADRTHEGNLAEARPDQRAALGPRDREPVRVVFVRRRPRPSRLASQKQREQGRTEGEHLRPQLRLLLGQRALHDLWVSQSGSGRFPRLWNWATSPCL